MLVHIVLFKIKDNNQENIQKVKELLSDMDGKIPFLRQLEVGTDVLHSERSYDVALYTRFDSMEDMQKYQVHPVHKKVQEFIATVREAAVSLDYEI